MNRTHLVAFFIAVFLFATASLSEAVSMNDWKNVTFWGSTRSAIQKDLGQPDNPGELDAWVISDSPDLMMAGMVGYTNEKVSTVFVVCQPKITFKEVKELQLKSDEVKFVSEDSQGVLFAFRKPLPGGPRFLAVTPADDASTGPMIAQAMDNPFEAAPSTSQAAAPNPAPAEISAPQTKPQSAAKDIDTGVFNLDVFDWGAADEAGKIQMLNRVKKLWRATGVETDKNAISAKTLRDKIHFPDQSLVFDQACIAAGIDPYGKVFRSLRGDN